MKIKLSHKIVNLLDKAHDYYELRDDEDVQLVIYQHGYYNFGLELRKSRYCDSSLEMLDCDLCADGTLLEALNELNQVLDDNFEEINLKKAEDKEDIIVLNGKEYKFTGNHK